MFFRLQGTETQISLSLVDKLEDLVAKIKGKRSVLKDYPQDY